MSDARHCDDYIGDFQEPKLLRQFLLLHRLPATEKPLVSHALPERIYADWKGRTVVLTTASRFGDVGINTKLDAHSYNARVPLSDLSRFRSEP